MNELDALGKLTLQALELSTAIVHHLLQSLHHHLRIVLGLLHPTQRLTHLVLHLLVDMVVFFELGVQVSMDFLYLLLVFV